ncbi:ATPase [Maribacter sp. 2307ULW6-5]|uniref:ATPase n=1 Tax=Maribacter sp. 2307ULW6-5 TaxID=3386275 RepID=UPI0039BC7637
MRNPSKLIVGHQEFKVAELTNNQLVYDFPMVLRFLEYRGKQLFGKKFRLHEADYGLIYDLVNYFIGDIDHCRAKGMDLEKGILLTGPVGCGKTALMKLMRYLVPHKPQYEVIPCRNVVFAFNHLGYKTIEDFGNKKHYCFDDLGVEPDGRHYAADCNVMGELLISRFELMQNERRITHLTTNLSASELEKRYGDRVRSRMREMFNLVAFSEDARDKRR